MNVRFIVTSPPAKAATFRVKLPLLVGRSDEAKFRIQQDRVSRKHCEFFEQDGGLYVRDLGSTNGTFLNGEMIESTVKVPLQSGAAVKVGSLEFRVEFAAAAAAAPQAAVTGNDETVSVARAADSMALEIEHGLSSIVLPQVKEAEEADRQPADDAFGFLVGEKSSQSLLDDDGLGDFIKGPK